MEFTGLVIVAAVAFSAPLILGLAPRLRLPAAVLEIVAGIAIGPAGLGWVALDAPIEVLSVIGLAFLLFLSGLEVDFHQLRGRTLHVTVAAFAVSFAIALGIGFALSQIGWVESWVLVGIILSATALGVVIPVLKDADESGSAFGQLVIAGASIADLGTILLLSILFSRESTDLTTRLVLIGGFAVLAALVFVAFEGAERLGRLSQLLLKLQDTTAQIRVRGAFLLLVAFAAMAERLGLEVILGAFIAGAMLGLLDRDYAKTHPLFHSKLEGVGFGVFIPVFFVASGVRFNLGALVASAETLARVPVFLIALVAARGLPAWLYRPLVGGQRAAVAGLLQATSLPFIVAATSIGVEMKALGETNAAALVAAGLLSVVIFPALALTLLKGSEKEVAAPAAS